MTARLSTSSLVGIACGSFWMLAAVACAHDTGDLFTPVGAAPPAGAGGSQATAPTTVAAGGGELPGTVTPPAASEGGLMGPLPVAPATAPPPAPAPAAAGEVEPVADVNPARVCPAIDQPLLLDFAQAAQDSAQALFGDFSQTFSGGTFVYPAGVPLAGAPLAGSASSDAGSAATPASTLGLASDVTGGDWHITGRVVEPVGFGLFFSCQQVDASRFAGVAFRVRGQVGPGSAISLRMRTAGNEVARQWFIETGNGAPATFGRCFPVSSQYDGTCEPSSVSVLVTPEGSDVLVRFDELGGGRPEPAVNPAELTQVEWALTPPAADAGVVASYDVDLHVDDIRFFEP